MKKIAILTFFGLSSQMIFASDLAIFENLGFSSDGSYFMFGQHVLRSLKGQAQAEIGIVDVAKNKFVSGGRKKGGWNVSMQPNQNSRGALYELLSIFNQLKERYHIDHMEQGRLLYTRSNGDESSEDPETEPALNFRDFEKAREYKLTLLQNARNTSGKVDAEFYIDVMVENRRGIESSFRVGRPGYYRAGIDSYEIIRIWADPDGDSIVIVIAKKSTEDLINYMVETLEVN